MLLTPTHQCVPQFVWLFVVGHMDGVVLCIEPNTSMFCWPCTALCCGLGELILLSFELLGGVVLSYTTQFTNVLLGLSGFLLLVT